MEKLSFKTAEFEGPLDLMLFLISKHKLDIYDIQISALLEQYIEYIQTMRDGDLELASEFLEMASRLVYIKTMMLLPRHEEEVQQLKTELEGQLLEYQVCKAVAAKLAEQNKMHERFVREPMKISSGEYSCAHSPALLRRAYQDAVGKGKRRLPPPVHVFNAIVSRRIVSVRSRIVFVLKKLYQSGQASYESLFLSSGDRSELVATFLAVLELVKGKRITVEQESVRLGQAFQSKHQSEEAKL